MTQEQVLEAWRRGGASRDRVLVKLSQDDILGWATRLLPGPAEGRRVAATLLSRSPQPEDALVYLLRLVTDGDRHTRDAAAHATGGLLIQHFDEVYPILGAWRTASDPLVRRAVVLVVGVAADPMCLDRVGPLLRLVDPLFTDRAREVRSAVEGVLSQALFSAYPDDVFEHVTGRSTSHDEQVLWHVATALGSSPATMARRALIVLRKLALDERRYVRGAVARALVRLSETSPDPVSGELRRWLDDPERGSVARAALGRVREEITGARPVHTASRSGG